MFVRLMEHFLRRCLTNIATGDHLETAAVLCAVPNMVEILNSNSGSTAGSLSRDSVQLQEQLCWALGNIAGDSDEHRSVLIGNGALRAVLSFLEARVSTLQGAIHDLLNAPGHPQDSSAGEHALPPVVCTAAHTAAWTLSNLARGKVSAHLFADTGTIIVVDVSSMP
jgi:hypothetical protein